MCKSSQETSDDGQEKVENSNNGLVSFSDSSMGRLDLGEILMIILLVLAVSMVVWYFCKKKRQRRLCDLREAVAYRPAGKTINYPHRRALPIQFAGTTAQPYTQSSAQPSAPTPGLWDQCQ